MKLRLILVFVLFCLSLSNVDGQTKGLGWGNYPNWKTVLENAKTSNRPIFLDLYTTWCGPCKWMDQQVYTIDSIGEFLNANFITVKVQMDSLKWDSEKIKLWYNSVQELKNTYNVKSFPTLLFLSPTGEIYQKIQGVRDAASLLREAREALDPKKQFATMLRAYDTGYRNPEFVMELVKLVIKHGDNTKARKMAKEYIEGLTDQDMLTRENVGFIYENTKTSTDRGFALFRDHGDEIERIEPKLKKKYTISTLVTIVEPQAIRPYRNSNKGKTDWKSISKAIAEFGLAGDIVLDWVKPNIIFDDEVKAFLETNPTWEAVQKKIEGYKFDERGTLKLYENTLFHYRHMYLKGVVPDNKILVKAADYYFKHPDVDLGNGDMVNSFAWMGFENFKDEKGLKAALGWSRIALSCAVLDASLLDTYANLLHKLGRNDEAVMFAGMAARAVPENKEIQENFIKIKAGIPTWSDK